VKAGVNSRETCLPSLPAKHTEVSRQNIAETCSYQEDLPLIGPEIYRKYEAKTKKSADTSLRDGALKFGKGSSAAAATLHDRDDDKALVLRGIDVINCIAAGEGQHIISDHQLDLVDRISLDIFLELLQSQPQSGSTSAKAFKDDLQDLAGIFRKNFLEFFTRCFGDCQHAASSILYADICI
jgi:hypothetical protein